MPQAKPVAVLPRPHATIDRAPSGEQATPGRSTGQEVESASTVEDLVEGPIEEAMEPREAAVSQLGQRPRRPKSTDPSLRSQKASPCRSRSGKRWQHKPPESERNDDHDSPTHLPL